MEKFVKDLQKLRAITSFYRDQVLFWACGQTPEERLGFEFKKRCDAIQTNTDTLQEKLLALLQDEEMPLQYRLIAITSRLETALDELQEVIVEEEMALPYRVLLESISLDISGMQAELGDFVAGAY